jgi:hypothetical protein
MLVKPIFLLNQFEVFLKKRGQHYQNSTKKNKENLPCKERIINKGSSSLQATNIDLIISTFLAIDFCS